MKKTLLIIIGLLVLTSCDKKKDQICIKSHNETSIKYSPALKSNQIITECICDEWVHKDTLIDFYNKNRKNESN